MGFKDQRTSFSQGKAFRIPRKEARYRVGRCESWIRKWIDVGVIQEREEGGRKLVELSSVQRAIVRSSRALEDVPRRGMSHTDPKLLEHLSRVASLEAALLAARAEARRHCQWIGLTTNHLFGESSFVPRRIAEAWTPRKGRCRRR